MSVAPPRILEALTGSMGELLNDFGGLRSTRLVAPVAEGASVLPVERAEGLPSPGIVLLDGVLYHYDRADGAASTLSGVYTLQLGVRRAGAVQAHARLAAVTDMSRTYSQLDALRNSYFLATAEAEDLSVCGRNYGLGRDPSIATDATYRASLLAIAYGPRGTLYGIQTALDAMLGAGRYTLEEDTLRYPCRIFVGTPRDNLLLDSYLGKTYLTGPTELAPSGQDFELGPDVLSVTSVRLAPTDIDTPCDAQRPSAAGRFAFVGSDESGSVNVLLGQPPGLDRCQLSGSAAYVADAPLDGSGTWSFSAILRPAPGTTLGSDPRQLGLTVSDGARAYTVGLIAGGSGVRAALCRDDGVILATSSASWAADAFFELGLEHDGRGRVTARQAGFRVASALAAAFGSSAARSLALRWAVPCELRRLLASAQPARDYANLSGRNGTLRASDPTALTSAAAPFVADDVGKTLLVFADGVPVAAPGSASGPSGSASGAYRVTQVDGAGEVHLSGGDYRGGALGGDPANPNRLDAGAPVFTHPRDIGRRVDLSAATGSNAGVYRIAGFLDAANRRLRLAYPTPSARALLVREDGSAPAFSANQGVPFSVYPVFPDASSIAFALVGATRLRRGASSATLSLREPLPLPSATYTLRANEVLGGQLVDSDLPVAFRTEDGPPPVYSAYPLYLADPFAFVENYLSKLTAAGVRAVFDVT